MTDLRYLEQAKALIKQGYSRETDYHVLAAKLQATQGKRLKENEPEEQKEVGDGEAVTVVDSRKSFIRKP